MDESKEINVVDVKIVPDRYLKPDTCEKILNEIYELEGLIRVLVHGPSLPKKVFYGPGKGHEVNHSDRKSINIRGESLDLRIMVGNIILTVDISHFNDLMDQLSTILDKNTPCDYSLLVGVFTRTKSTISDYLKYENRFKNYIDEHYIDLINYRAISSQSVKVIK